MVSWNIGAEHGVQYVHGSDMAQKMELSPSVKVRHVFNRHACFTYIVTCLCVFMHRHRQSFVISPFDVPYTKRAKHGP